jgi:hypothetical protein
MTTWARFRVGIETQVRPYGQEGWADDTWLCREALGAKKQLSASFNIVVRAEYVDGKMTPARG